MPESVARQLAWDVALVALALTGIVLASQLTAWVRPAWPPLFTIASLGASMTLLLGSPESPLARVYPALAGNTVSAAIGLVVARLSPGGPAYLAPCVAVLVAIAAMRLLRAVHPPGGATALLIASPGAPAATMGWWFPVVPIFVGTAWLLVLGRLRLGSPAARESAVWPPASRVAPANRLEPPVE